MASFWDEIQRDHEQRGRGQRRTDAWLQRELAADTRRTAREQRQMSRADRAEAAGKVREAGLDEAARREAEIAEVLAVQAGLLSAVVRMPPATLAALRNDVFFPEFVAEGIAEDPRPTWQDFAPAEPTLFGRRRYARDLTEAQSMYAQAVRGHDRRHEERVAVALREHEAHTDSLRREHHRRWDELADAVARAEPAAVAEFVGAVLRSNSPLASQLIGGRAVYQADARELVVELEMPDTDAIPPERGWKYVPARQAVEPQPQPFREAERLYADLISRIVLGCMHACLRAADDALVDVVSVNGHVRTIDPATGRQVHPCLITVTSSRSTFDELVLDSERLKPEKCLAALGAVLSPHPYELEPVRPFVDVDLAQYRLVMAAEALVEIDHRADLLAMNPYDFEKLIQRLFSAMGYTTWRTTSSRDDGIDALATKPDEVLPFECVIQAKRFSKAVPPRDVQALMGAMAEHGTATHGVLVTTSWLSDRSRQRARAQRIVTFEGNNLIYLLEKYLDLKVVISTRPPSRRR